MWLAVLLVGAGLLTPTLARHNTSWTESPSAVPNQTLYNINNFPDQLDHSNDLDQPTQQLDHLDHLDLEEDLEEIRAPRNLRAVKREANHPLSPLEPGHPLADQRDVHRHRTARQTRSRRASGPVTNLQVTETTSTSITAQWRIPYTWRVQWFRIQWSVNDYHVVEVRSWKSTCTYTITDLIPGTKYQISVYSRYGNAYSNPTTIPATTLAEDTTGTSDNSNDNDNPDSTSLTTRPGRPDISHTGDTNGILFHWSNSQEASDDLQYRYQTKRQYKACSETAGWSGWSEWSSTSSTRESFRPTPYTDLTVWVKVRNSREQEGQSATYTASIPSTVPINAVTALTCQTSCIASVENNCRKDNGPRFKVTFEITLADAGQGAIIVQTVSGTPDDNGRAAAEFSGLQPFTRYRVTAYPANNKGKNPSLTKTLTFRTNPTKPGLVRDLQQQEATQTELTLTWNDPADTGGDIVRYEVTLKPENDPDQEGPTETAREKTITFGDLEVGQAYIVEVKACNNEHCNDPYNLTVWTRPEPPTVTGEVQSVSSTSTTVTISLPTLINPPGWQWIVVEEESKSPQEGNETDDSQEDLQQRAKSLVCQEEGKTDCLERNKRQAVDDGGGSTLRIAAKVLQEVGSLQEEFTVGDNKTYHQYHNAPLKDQQSYSAVVVTQKTAGKYQELIVSRQVRMVAGGKGVFHMSMVLIPVGLLVLLILQIPIYKIWKRMRNADLDGDMDPLENNRVRVVVADGRVVMGEVVPEQEVILFPEQIVARLEEEENIYDYVQKLVPESDLEIYLNRVISFSETDEEFKIVPANMGKSTTAGEQPTNRKKNRFKNNLPYDDTRVKIPEIPGQPYSDYINASLVQGPIGGMNFIASQGPKAISMNTVGHFWKMIWSKRSCIIVHLEGNDQESMAQYWPDTENKLIKHGMKIKVVSIEEEEDYIVRLLHLTKGSVTRKVRQFQYYRWPMHGVPHNTLSLAHMIRAVRREKRSNPITVLSCAGIGRTGTVILVLWLLDMLHDQHKVNVREALLQLREERPSLVENTKQYKLAHQLLLDIAFDVRRMPCSEFSSRLRSLRGKPSIILQQYQTLEEKKRRTTKSFQIAQQPQFARFNRHRNILPEDERLAFLQDLGEGRVSQYINVVQVNGFNRRNQYLAGEHPQRCTLDRIWRLVYEQRSAVWVNLQHFTDQQLFPEIVSGEGEETLGAVKLCVGSLEMFQNFSERTVTVTMAESSYVHQVTVLYLTRWADNKVVPSRPQSLVATLHRTAALLDNKSTALLTCRDGVTGCGVASALLLILANIDQCSKVDVFSAVLSVLYDRHQFIISPEQYDFLHTAAEAYIVDNSFCSIYDVVQPR